MINHSHFSTFPSLRLARLRSVALSSHAVTLPLALTFASGPDHPGLRYSRRQKWLFIFDLCIRSQCTLRCESVW